MLVLIVSLINANILPTKKCKNDLASEHTLWGEIGLVQYYLLQLNNTATNPYKKYSPSPRILSAELFK